MEISYVILFFACLFFSAFFSSCETAFLSLQRIRMKHLEMTGVAEADRVSRIMKRPERFLAAVLFGNNIVNTAAAALATGIAITLWGQETGVVAATIVTAVALLLVGEIIPKTIATQYAERISLVYARPVGILLWILSPVVSVLGWMGGSLAEMVAGPNSTPKTLVTEDEIRTMIKVGKLEGVVEEGEARMLHNVFEFGDHPVRDAMTPRPDLSWVEEGMTLGRFLDLYAQLPHSRFPVFKGDHDEVIGMLSIKDVLMSQAMNNLSRDEPIDSLVRPIIFIPNTKRIGETFSEMQSRDIRMAVVVDEFGSVDGIVTLEQLLEEIVGYIGDELRGVQKDFEAIDERTFEVDGGMRVEEANEFLELNLPEGDYETVAGFVLTHLGRIPEQGEQLKYENLKIVIVKVRGRRLEKITFIKE
ncbi:MAG: hemolysin family protein [Chloroflexota bacterium]|nr:hemolysin family protein [Chloroflexota bacterium]